METEPVALDAHVEPVESRPFPSAADRLVPPADPDLRVAWRIVSGLGVLACCVVVLVILQPVLLLRDTTPSGGDLGAHVWFPAFLRDHLLPNWRVAGWSNDWFGGFPAGQFYFPLPALITVLLDLVLPYNVALKLTTALGPVLMPVGAYAFGRGLRLRRPGPEFLAVATVLFLFFQGIAAAPDTAAATIQFNQRIMGGPLVSALAGEYSFSLGFTLALFALGALAVSLRTGERVWLPTVLLAATVMSHVVVGIYAVVGAVIVTVVMLTAGRVRRVLTVSALVGVVAALLTAFWTLPLLATFGYTANMRYEKLTQYLDYLFIGEFLWISILALVGAVLAIGFRDRAGIVLVLFAAVWAPVFALWPELHAWNLRFLPFWYLGLHFVAAVGAAEIVRRLSGEIAHLFVGSPPTVGESYDTSGAREGRLYRVASNVMILVAVVAVVTAGVSYAALHRGFLPFWATWNSSGYENAAAPGDTTAKGKGQKQYSEYRALIDRMAELPAGRAMWEGGSAIDDYGTPLALMLLPYWTDGRIQSFEGLYYESAASTPYVFMMISPLSATENSSDPVRGLDYLDLDRFNDGVDYLRALGGRYYLAHSDAAKAAADTAPGLRFIDEVRDRDNAPPKAWSIYEVRDHALVAPMPFEPVVVTPKSGTQAECFGRADGGAPGSQLRDPWECTAVGWWSHPATIDRPLTADGPAAWKRTSVAAAPSVVRRPLPPVEVTDIRETDNDINFRVSQTGVPVVVRTSYFPNWTASGADGPWRLTPNLMVVMPTERDVHLHFGRSGPEKLGGLLSFVGLVALAGLVVWNRKRGPIGPSARPPTPEMHDDPVVGAASAEAGAPGPGTMGLPPGEGGEDPKGPGP